MRLAGATIAVTGATGFLGRYLVEALADRGARVVGVVRNPDRAPELPSRGVELRRADLAEPDALARGFRGVDAVVSNAALFRIGYRPNAEYLRTNLEGTRNVVEAAAKAGVERIVQISSVVVYRPGKGEPVDEDHAQHDETSPVRPWTVYAISKALAEQAAWRETRERGIALTCLRPSGIYGAFDENFMRFTKAIAWPPISVWPAFLHLPVVYAGDVAEAAARALESDASAGRAYNTCGEHRTAWQFLRDWRAAGARAPRVAIPLPVPIRPRYAIDRAERELGWRNRPIVDGLREMLEAERAGPAARRTPAGSATQPNSNSEESET